MCSVSGLDLGQTHAEVALSKAAEALILGMNYGPGAATHLMRSARTSLGEARRIAQCSNSYSRLKNVLDLKPAMRNADWWKVLGEFWSVCDNISLTLAAHEWAEYAIMEYASRRELNWMMGAKERAAWQALPETVTVYRGCYQNNQNGLSWSLNREVAEEFPRLRRYRQDGTPMLITGTALREDCALKLDHDEDEVICNWVTPTRVDVLEVVPT
jgi:hypothetical protein